jgi:hypothetical protein
MTDKEVAALVISRLDAHENFVESRLDDQDAVLNDIRTETRKTNSRITKLELWRAKAEGFKAAFHWVEVVASTAIGAGIGALVTLFLH